MSAPKTVKQFLSFTEPNRRCLEWTRCFNSDGYARCNWKGDANGKVHRIIYQLAHPEEDISDKVIRHRCDNTKCIRPSHLVSGTSADNMLDRDLRGRHGLAKLTRKTVETIRALAPHFKRVELAKRFRVNPRTISSVILRNHFKHVE